jgi:hypothetical protein
MKKQREHDPELAELLRAFREVHPTDAELGGWKAAIAAELRDSEVAPAPVVSPLVRVYRFPVRAALQIGVAASLGLLIGAYLIERRYDQGQATVLFSQIEPSGISARAPATMDDQREIVRINLDANLDTNLDTNLGSGEDHE